MTASDGVKPLTMEDEGHYHDGEEHAEHADHAKGHDDDEDDEEDEEEEVPDPHAWQDLANGKIYVANIRDGLIDADPEGRAVYETNVAKYLEAIAKEEAAVQGGARLLCRRRGARSSPATTPSAISARPTGSRSSRRKA